MEEKNINVVELFAGVGGFNLGLKSASPRYKTLWANQWEPGKKTQHAYDCYLKHFGMETTCINEDIAKVKHQVPQHDLLVGGFPCQDYSVAATNAKGIEGKKWVLWWEIRDILEMKKTPYLLLENVDRLIKSPASQRGRDFGIILRCLTDLGYCVQWRVINAAEYGHPQKRRRAFIFACHESTLLYNKYKDLSPETILLHDGILAKSFPSSLKYEELKPYLPVDISESSTGDLVNFSKIFKCDFKNAGYIINGQLTTFEVKPRYEGNYILLKDILDDDVDNSYFLGGELSLWQYMKGSKKELRYKPNGEPYNYTEGAIPFPDNLDSPARTILTSESSKNRSTHVVIDKSTLKYRLLTPEECEKINEFPVGWTNTGMPHKFRYFTMGNALVVGIITSIGKTLADEI